MRIATAIPFLVALLGAGSVQGRRIAQSASAGSSNSFGQKQQQQLQLQQLQQLPQLQVNPLLLMPQSLRFLAAGANSAVVEFCRGPC